MAQDDELRKRLEALERENRELRDAAAKEGRGKVIRYSFGDFKGKPTISFEVGGRHLTLGVRKAAIVLRCIDQLKRFVLDNKAEMKEWDVVRGVDGEKPANGSDDLKI